MPDFLTEVDTIAAIYGLTRDRLVRFVVAEVVVPAITDAGPVFRHIDVARLRLLCELSDDLDLDDDSLGVIMSLIDQLHDARFALHAVAVALVDESDEVRARVGTALAQGRA